MILEGQYIINRCNGSNRLLGLEITLILRLRQLIQSTHADDIKKYNNIFKHIIIFTNDRDPKKNKTLKNIYDAIENLKKDGIKIGGE